MKKTFWMLIASVVMTIGVLIANCAHADGISELKEYKWYPAVHAAWEKSRNAGAAESNTEYSVATTLAAVKLFEIPGAGDPFGGTDAYLWVGSDLQKVALKKALDRLEVQTFLATASPWLIVNGPNGESNPYRAHMLDLAEKCFKGRFSEITCDLMAEAKAKNALFANLSDSP